MAAVTQRIPNYLGGVSQQTDNLKFPGQLRECINGYPDPTFGLIKRPGGKFLVELKNADNSVVAPGTYDNGKWFSIFRDSAEQYVGVISGTTIRVWSLIDGSPKTVTYGSGATSYLTGTKDDYDLLTINDYTFITNKTVVVTTQAAPTYNYKRRATIKLINVQYGAKYEVTLGTTTVSYTTRNAEVAITTPSNTERDVTADIILNDLVTKINAISGGGYTATKLGTTIEVTRSSAFDITVKGGVDADSLECFQDTVENLSKLPNKAFHNRIVEVSNSVNTEDNYYLKFIATNGVSGEGYWEETVKPDVSPGLTNATMPHQLIRNLDGTFTFQRGTWEPRLVGDDDSNSHPSFVGSTIKQLFFYNNRLGTLTEENVSMSQSGDFFNFYHNTALTTIASDPVDINCSSIRPAILHGVVPVAQGLLLFSRSQQFLMEGSQGVFTPGGTTIKTISNYEMDEVNDPVDLGTTVAFISKTPSYVRVFEMQTRGQDESPVVSDVSRIVPEWIPSTIDQVVSSPQNSLLSLGSTGSRDLYLFRFYSNGDQREIQSWFKWTLSGEVTHHAVDRDVFWAVTEQQNAYVVQKISLIQSPTSSTFLTADGSRVDPRLDMWATPSSKVFVNTVGDRHTKVYLPFKGDSTRTLCVVTANPNLTTPTYSNSGLVLFPEVLQDGGGFYAKVPELDLTAEDLIVGYTYSMDYELPQVFYRSGDNQQVTDYTASLVVARLKFLLGLGGDVVFKLRARGRTEWQDTQGVKAADYYLANDIPFVNTAEFTVPIHQRAENINVRVFSDSPFPVSLVSMMWEGNYSPRFYTRR
jgi:hypothetical protein